MERFEHGGDIYTHPGLVDFSASLNPLGMPAKAREALRTCADACAAYPDPHCRELTAALAAFERVDPAWVQPTAGATDAIWRLCQALRPRRALLCAPCYAGYEQALEQVGCEVVWHELRREDGFALDEALLPAMAKGVDLVILANPNNPTGRTVPRRIIAACVAKARSTGAVVALDECFVDLTAHRGCSDLVARHPNLVVIKALTKTFALAGLRVGYALCSDERLLQAMERVAQPWAVSVPAQLAGVASLKEEGYLERSRELVARERTRLAEALVACGLVPMPSEANYLLFEGPATLGEDLRARGILVRPCDNFRGLGECWWRIAVRTPGENDLLIAALREVCA